MASTNIPLGSLIPSPCTPKTLDEFLSFSATHNALPSQHTLHVDTTVQGIKNDAIMFGFEPTRDWFGFRDCNNDLIAVVGAETNSERTFAALHGPWVKHWPERNNEVLKMILEEGLEKLGGVESIAAYMDEKAGEFIGVLEDVGFVKTQVGIDMEITKNKTFVPVEQPEDDGGEENDDKEQQPYTIRIINPTDSDTNSEILNHILKIHRDCFPQDAHYTSSSSFTHPLIHIFAIFPSQSTTPIGYALIKQQSDLPYAYVEHVGVCSSMRGKGAGSFLLKSIVEWFKTQKGLEKMNLNVNEKKTGARRIYERVGFVVHMVGVGMKLERKMGG